MAHGLEHQQLAAETGYWPLYRFDPRRDGRGEPPLVLDSPPPKIDVSKLMATEESIPAHGATGSRALPSSSSTRRAAADREAAPGAVPGAGRRSGRASRAMTWLDRRLILASRWRHPFMPGASPLRRSRHGAAARGRRRGGDRDALAVRGADPARALRRPRSAEALAETVARGAVVFSRATNSRSGRPVSRAGAGGSSRASAVPVIASLNGTTAEGWLELRDATSSRRAPPRWSSTSTTSPPTRSRTAGRRTSRRRHRRGAEGIDPIPVAVKLSPFYSSLPHLAASSTLGAAGLVLFNRFYQPDIDPEHARNRARDCACRIRPSCCCGCAGWRFSRGPGRGSLAVTGGVHEPSTPSRPSWPAPTPCSSSRRCCCTVLETGPNSHDFGVGRRARVPVARRRCAAA